jgi:hypothetical protein
VFPKTTNALSQLSGLLPDFSLIFNPKELVQVCPDDSAKRPGVVQQLY